MFVSSLSQSSGMVNAAFLQEVKESNTEVWALVRSLRASLTKCDNATEDEAHACVRQLAALRDGIASEFSMEETLGFVGGVSPSNANPESDLAKAARQHRAIYVHLHEVCQRAEELEYRGTIVRDLPSLLAEYSDFDAQLRKHEEFEAEMIRDQLGKHAF